MFQHITQAPPDAILGLTEAFLKDPNPAKINLSVGVYQDASGKTPTLSTVRQAEQRIVESQASKSYLPISGSAEFGKLVQQLLFGADHEVIASGRAATAHTPGGTGALRVAADYIHQNHPQASIWLSKPTWANHAQIFQAAGLTVKEYPYFDADTNGLAFDAMIQALQNVPAGDVVLLHGCCHNPTGVDPTAQQWARIADVLGERGVLPLVDFAYQGFGQGLREDAAGLLTLCRPDAELLICSSFSKNFGLYRDRVGALTVVARTAEQTQAVFSQIKRCIRSNYSNPPAHGGLIVTTILNDPDLRRDWEQELQAMRDRVRHMRELFVQTLTSRGVGCDLSFITRQLGMFSFSGLTKQQVQQLRDQYALYIVDSGRINVAGMTEANMAPLCDAIAAVMKE